MRFVQTADLHLDACFASPGFPADYGNRRRQSLRDVFRAVATRAAEWPADALLIPGDLFDLERVSRDTVAFLRATFEAIHPVPVVIAPGNHDPFTAESPYATEAWPDNVLIFSEPVWSAFVLGEGRLVIHGFAFDDFEISSNPFGTLEIPQDDALHVAVAHGTERAHQPPDGKSYAPFDAAEAAVPGLAYLALGHFHRMTEPEGDHPTRMCYSGAPEAHDFGQAGPRHYLEVEIDNGEVGITPVPSARVVYATHDVDCREMATSQELVDAIRGCALEGDTPQIARITLKGPCESTVLGELPAVYDAVASEFEYVQLVDETEAAEDYEELARETTSLGAFIARMNEEVADAPDAARRALLERAREAGLAAYRGQKLGIRGLDFEGGAA